MHLRRLCAQVCYATRPGRNINAWVESISIQLFEDVMEVINPIDGTDLARRMIQAQLLHTLLPR